MKFLKRATIYLATVSAIVGVGAYKLGDRFRVQKKEIVKSFEADHLVERLHLVGYRSLFVDLSLGKKILPSKKDARPILKKKISTEISSNLDWKNGVRLEKYITRKNPLDMIVTEERSKSSSDKSDLSVIKKEYEKFSPDVEEVILAKKQYSASERKIIQGRGSLEINNDELIELKRFEYSAKKNNFSALALLEKSHIEEELIALERRFNSREDSSVDEVIVAAAPKRNPAITDQVVYKPIKEDKVKLQDSGLSKAMDSDPDDGLITFDYSKPESQVTTQVSPLDDIPEFPVVVGQQKKAISREVAKAMSRAINQSPKLATTQKSVTPLTALEPEAYIRSENEGCDYSGVKGEAVVCLAALDIHLDSQKSEGENQVFNYSVSPAFDPYNKINDDSSGKVSIRHILSGDSGNFIGTMERSGRVPTHIDLELIEGSFDMAVPFISSEGLERLFEKNEINTGGGILLFDLEEDIDIVEIDQDYTIKLFFAETFKQVREEEDYRYVMFVGVEPGNVLSTFRTMKSKLIQKIVHVYDDEITFEFTSYIKSKNKIYRFLEENAFSKVGKPLGIEGEMIKNFNAKGVAKQISLDSYKIKLPHTFKGERNYFKMEHLSAPIFIGTQTENVLLPTESFISNALEAHELSDLEGSCLIQVNLSKRVLDYKLEGSTRNGVMAVRANFIDNDGQFNSEITTSAKKIFIQGDLQGQIFLNVKYEDETEDLLKSYCSDGTYLLEQL